MPPLWGGENCCREDSAMRKKLLIEGMSCGHCVKHATEALQEVAGVTHVEVTLENKSAVIEGNNISNESLKTAIDEVGYVVISIEELQV